MSVGEAVGLLWESTLQYARGARVSDTCLQHYKRRRIIAAGIASRVALIRGALASLNEAEIDTVGGHRRLRECEQFKEIESALRDLDDLAKAFLEQ